MFKKKTLLSDFSLLEPNLLVYEEMDALSLDYSD